jgi:predicted amidophosphoribosyltransferase
MYVLTTPPAAAAWCRVCQRHLPGAEGRCRNPLCASASRWFLWNVSVAPRTATLAAALDAYKYRGEARWSARFGRLIARRLGERGLIDSFDLVVASPTYVGEGGRRFDHTRALLREAAAHTPEARRTRFDLGPVPAVIRSGPAPRLTGRTHEERRRIAETEIRPLLRVPDPARTSGRRILVVDDVFTDGRTLNEVARALRLRGGAREVCGLSLSRQPWRERGVAQTGGPPA